MHLELIAKELVANTYTLNQLYVIVPSYRLVKDLSIMIHKLKGLDNCLLPNFFTLEDFFLFFKIKSGDPLYSINALEMKIALSSILKKCNISLNCLDEYLNNIQKFIDEQKFSQKFLTVKEDFFKYLKSNRMITPKPLDEDQINWLIKQCNINNNHQIFLISTLENFQFLKNTPKNIRVFQPPSFHSFNFLPQIDNVIATYHQNVGQKLNNHIEIVEFANKFELTRSISMIMGDSKQPIIVNESYDLTKLLAHQISLIKNVNNFINLLSTNEFKLFINIVKLSFNDKNNNLLIDICTSPVGIFNQKNISWLKHEANDQNIMERIKTISPYYYDVLNSISYLPDSLTLVELLNHYHELFSHLISTEIANANILFEIKNFINQLKLINLNENNIFKEDFFSFIISSANSYTIEQIGTLPLPIINLIEADYIATDHLIFIENGLAHLEKTCQDESSKSIADLYLRLNWMFSIPKVTIIRHAESKDISIFFTLLKHYHNNLITDKYNIYISSPQIKLSQPIFNIALVNRPLTYSVTQISKLIADPYCFAAEYILKLKPKDKLWEGTETKDFGIMVHEILALIDFNDKSATYQPIFDKILNRYNLNPSEKLILSLKFNNIIDFIKDYYNKNLFVKSFSECAGKIQLNIDNVLFNITARADRIDLISNQSINIIDFKTGQLPSQKMVDQGKAPQLPIESLIASSNGFTGLTDISNINCHYISLSGRSNKQKVFKINTNVSQTKQSLENLLSMFYTNLSGYFATPTEVENIQSKFKHFKRLQEWFENI